MLNPNPRTRLATTAFVDEAASTGFWSGNALATLVEGLDGFELRSEGEKLALLRTIKDAAGAGTIPQPFLLYRVLPSLLHSLSLPTAPSSAMLPLVLELGKLVSPGDYGKLVLEPVVKLYASPDRGTRMALLDGLGEYADKMDNRMVQDKVWPHLVRAACERVLSSDHRFRRYCPGHQRSDRQSCVSPGIKGMLRLCIGLMLAQRSYSEQRSPPPSRENADGYRAFHPHKHVYPSRSTSTHSRSQHKEEGSGTRIRTKSQGSIRPRQSGGLDGIYGHCGNIRPG